ncbi:MAG: outer membrane protein assembly factor BamA [Candidatus Omnitrophica bacterium]|nr:outer membrane protein assembly factor BamA [Candidatus Omnitrophota bacterium]
MRKTIFVFFLLLLLLGVSLPAIAASDSELGITTTEASSEKLVTGIEIQGNKNISTNTIVSKMKTKIGTPYVETVVSDDLKRLYLLGFFSDIKIDTEPYKDGVKVIVRVVERPIIEKITFTGMVHITKKDETLKKELKSKEGQYLDYPTLTEDVHILKKMYEKVGFNQADIQYTVDIDKEKNKAKVQFNVNESKKVRVKDVYFEGNIAFNSKRLQKIIKTKRAWLFNAGVLKDDVLKDDVERLKAFYRHSGYADVAVEYVVLPDAAKTYLLYITFKINEGKLYKVGNITIQGNKDVVEKEVLSKLEECPTGKVFSEEGVKGDLSNIQSLYFDRGYISCLVQDTTAVNDISGRVDVNYTIVENQVSYVDKVKVRGNVKTKDLVIRRELRIHPGDRFDGTKLKRSKERLQNLGFFDEVSYDTEDTDVPDKKDLVVDVKESKTGAFSFGGGYSTVDQFVGFVEVEQKNFDWKNWPYFTGAGQNLKFRGSFGSVTTGFDLSFTEPWLFDYPISFGFDGYHNEHKRDEDSGYGYDQTVTGGDLRLGKELTEYWRASGVYRLDRITISNITTNASQSLLDEYGTNYVSSVTPGIAFDSRDNIFDTHSGNLVTASMMMAGGPFGGDKDFWKFYGRASHYFPMFRKSTLEIRGRMGMEEVYSDTVSVPIYERFFAGGADTIRGYEERMVGPIDPISLDPLGGNALLIGNIEYLYPLFDFLKVAAFYDVGNVWEKLGEMGTGGFKSGIGLGVRVKTPIGPIRLDYGIPMNTEPGSTDTKGGRFHFSASNTF